MTFAVTPDVRFNTGRDEATWVLSAEPFIRLDIADQRVLSDWLDAASGIATVADITDRPWNIGGARLILGVFETGQDQASWLIVRSGSGWALAGPRDGSVTGESDSLRAILRLIDVVRGA